MNTHAISAIYRFEMSRFGRTLWQSLVTPVITTSLYFIVFGAAIGGRMSEVDGVPYGAFIVPGLVMLSVKRDNIVRPGMMNAAYSTPSISAMREPIADPKTTK